MLFRRVSRCLLPFVGLFSFWSAGCLSRTIPSFPNQLQLRFGGQPAPLRIVFFPQEELHVSDVVQSMEYAAHANRLWGVPEKPVTLFIFPTQKTLTEAVGHHFPWLRAWARYDTIWIQSPQTWGDNSFYWPLTELLTHEYNHVIMFQMCCDSESWKKSQIPLWFREGMASVTANQGYHYSPENQLKATLQTPQGQKIIKNPRSALSEQQPLLYGMSHYLFASLLGRLKHEGVKRILQTMRQGSSWDVAFRQVAGMSEKAFVEGFSTTASLSASPSPPTPALSLQPASPAAPRACLLLQPPALLAKEKRPAPSFRPFRSTSSPLLHRFGGFAP